MFKRAFVPGKVLSYDIDWMKHMNNTKYLCAAKLARLSALLQAGFWSTPYQITSYSASYYKEIKLSQPFLVKTQVRRQPCGSWIHKRVQPCL